MGTITRLINSSICHVRQKDVLMRNQAGDAYRINMAARYPKYITELSLSAQIRHKDLGLSEQVDSMTSCTIQCQSYYCHLLIYSPSNLPRQRAQEASPACKRITRISNVCLIQEPLLTVDHTTGGEANSSVGFLLNPTFLCLEDRITRRMDSI